MMHLAAKAFAQVPKYATGLVEVGGPNRSPIDHRIGDSGEKTRSGRSHRTQSQKPTGSKTTSPTHAKLPHVFLHASGLFQNLAACDRKRLPLNAYWSSKNMECVITGTEPLDATDLRVVQALGAISTSMFHRDPVNPQLLEEDCIVRRSLQCTGFETSPRLTFAKFKIGELAACAGYKHHGGSTLRIIRESLDRLSKVVVVINGTTSFRVISTAILNPSTGEWVVGLNPVITEAILNQNGGYVRVDMNEVAKLKTSAARILHNRLHFINQGEQRTISLDKLVSYVYPDATDVRTTKKQRRQAVRTALLEMPSLCWSAVKDKSGTYIISRPAPRQAAAPQRR